MITTKVTVTKIEERFRKEWISGHGEASITREVSTGWWIVVDCGGGALALHVGAERPDVGVGPAVLRLSNE